MKQKNLQEIPWTYVEYPTYRKTRITPTMTWCYGLLEERMVRYRGREFTNETFPEWLITLRHRITKKLGLLLMLGL